VICSVAVEIKRCISIFPIFGIEGKQQVQQLTFSIKRSFEAMVKRYPRSSAILEEITNDAVINILLEGASSSGASAEANDTNTSSTNTATPATNARVHNTTAASTPMSGRSQLSTSSSFSQANGVLSSVAERYQDLTMNIQVLLLLLEFLDHEFKNSLIVAEAGLSKMMVEGGGIKLFGMMEMVAEFIITSLIE